MMRGRQAPTTQCLNPSEQTSTHYAVLKPLTEKIKIKKIKKKGTTTSHIPYYYFYFFI